MPDKPSIRLRFVALFVLVGPEGLGACGFWNYVTRKHEKEADLADRCATLLAGTPWHPAMAEA